MVGWDVLSSVLGKYFLYLFVKFARRNSCWQLVKFLYFLRLLPELKAEQRWLGRGASHQHHRCHHSHRHHQHCHHHRHRHRHRHRRRHRPHDRHLYHRRCQNIVMISLTMMTRYPWTTTCSRTSWRTSPVAPSTLSTWLLTILPGAVNQGQSLSSQEHRIRLYCSPSIIIMIIREVF